jgi:hypothetical protein
MPAKRSAPAPAASRPQRTTKTQASETIAQAIKKGSRRTTVPTQTTQTTSPEDDSDHSIDHETLMAVIEALPQIQGAEERFQAIEDSLKANQVELRATLNDTFGQIMDRLDTMETRPSMEQGPGMGIRIAQTAPAQQLDFAQGINYPPFDPHDVLSRYSWVDKSVVKSIADGEFDIHDLPKLHREEEPRSTFKGKITDGVHFPADGGKPELVTTRTKMQSAFKDLTTFLSAWLIYVSIRTSFAPERGPGLTFWTERLVFYTQEGFPWTPVTLNYAIAYYTAHQNSSPETWYNVNTDRELAINHFAVARKNPHQGSSSSTTQHRSTSPKKSASSIPIQDQTCANWNRSSGGCTYNEKYGQPCPRKHRCAICLNPAHKAGECPSKSST